jgi:hypothetical protein
VRRDESVRYCKSFAGYVVTSGDSVAEIAGGFFVPGVDPVQGVDLFEQLSKSLSRVSDLAQTIAGAISDRRVTVSEMNDIKRSRTELATEINKLVSIAAGMPD